MTSVSAPAANNYLPFPPKAQAVLDSVYNVWGLTPEQTDERIEALRRHFKLGNMVVAADGGINDNKELLRALEFYVLQTRNYLEDSNEEN